MPAWLRIGVPVLILLMTGALLIWLIGTFLGFIVKLLIGSLVVVGFVALIRGERSSRV
ncbi:hypothetical protein [Yinghuangia seranimata]|uniref:hypothetical protein n=1 Tax=Yinghuangia seranimata TaxID=408067 RepID=UPI00248AD1D9|nr:hypothetical protein [Yinghuangia seranimata]MDI2130420.1 hypothetical protein [Yinghuangia seranimata]